MKARSLVFLVCGATLALLAGCGSSGTSPAPGLPATPGLPAPRVTLAYTSRDRVAVTVHTTGAAQVVLECDLQTGHLRETIPIAPGEPARFDLALPDRARTYPLRITAVRPGQPTADAIANGVEICSLPGTGELRRRLAAAAADGERRARVLTQILDLRHQLYRLGGRRFPNPDEVAQAPAPALAAAVARARQIATDWLRREHALDAELLASLLRVESAAEPLDPEAACRLIADAYRLAEIDAAGEVVFGRPVLDLSAGLLQLVRVTRGDPLPASGYRPIAALKSGLLAGVLDDSALSFWTSARFAQVDTMVTIWNDSVKRVIDRLAVPDPADPTHQSSIWYELGSIPRPFPSGPVVRIGVEASHFSPEMCLWLRVGSTRAIPFRNELSMFRGFMTVRGDPHLTSTTLVAEVPAPLLAGAGTKLYARLEAFSLENGRPVTIPREIWLADLVVR